jgi:amidase
VIQGFEVWQHYGAFITAQHPALGPGIRERMEYAAGVTREEADVARGVLRAIRASIRRTLSPGTVLCLPTAPCIAPEVSASGDALDTFRSRVMALTCTAGLAGLPQVTLPIGQVAGFPVGASLVGWAGADETLLGAAAALGAWCGT